MAKRRKHRGEARLMRDVGLIVLSIILSFVLVQTNALDPLLHVSTESALIGTMMAGMFFTSVFTTAPAIATLGQISLEQPLIVTAILGAAGSVLGDLLIFRFVKDRLSAHIVEVLKERGMFRRIAAVLRYRYFRWFTFLLGGLIIASPLPDELGITLLGFSKMKTAGFIALSFLFNSIGIIGIGLAARALVGA